MLDGNDAACLKSILFIKWIYHIDGAFFDD
jgi:hypothetical protein